MCGGTARRRRRNPKGGGLSPRVRGNLNAPTKKAGSRRSIPACAGEPGRRTGGAGASRVYPRVCGGTRPTTAFTAPAKCLSPRVRGNPCWLPSGARFRRSIPACAGEPPQAQAGRRLSGVYPRVCGGTRGAVGRRRQSGGLSPRVRGNPPEAQWRWRRSRSIPACAGEPPRRSRWMARQRVYPRVCGGTASA